MGYFIQNLKTYIGCLSVIFFLCYFKSASAADLSNLSDPDVAETFVDNLVLPLMEKHHSPSGSVSIVKDGKLIFAKGYGLQNIEQNIPVDPFKTTFRMASVSKLLTWVAVMQMVEQGELDLDTDVNQYLSGFQIKNTYPDQPVTLRHIMTHTAGFEDGFFGTLIVKKSESVLPLAQSMKKLQPKRVNPPGVQTAYSNYGASLAGLIVSNVSGMEFNAYIQKNIFNILNMNDSYFSEYLSKSAQDNMAVSYAYSEGQFVEKPRDYAGNFGPAGALISTSVDMAKFSQSILDNGLGENGRILKEETVRQMLTRNFSHHPKMMGQALGFYERDISGVRVLGHWGDLRYFHSELEIDPTHNMAIFNTFSGTGGSAVRTALIKTLYGEFNPVEIKPIAPPEGFSQRAEKYAGIYIYWRSNFSKVEKIFQMNEGMAVYPTERNTLMVPGFGDSSEYVEVSHNYFRQVDGRDTVAFQENAQGEITGYVLSDATTMSTFKAPAYYGNGFTRKYVGLALLVFMAMFIRIGYLRFRGRGVQYEDKTVRRAVIVAAISHLLTVFLIPVLAMPMLNNPYREIAFSFKLWLVFPILATLATVYLAYTTYLVWTRAHFGGVFARVGYSLVTMAAVFMCWFYYIWNILGFQFFA